MRLRLGFAVATLLDPEVLVTDEVLGVGDEAFQRKCSRYFDRFLGAGGTLVLCSHDLAQIEERCANTLWLEAGAPAGFGESREVVRAYRASLGGEGSDDGAGATHAPGESAGLPYEVVALSLTTLDGHEVKTIPSRTTIVAEAEVLAHAGVPHIVFGVTRADLTPVYGVSSDMDGAEPESLGAGRYRFRLTFFEPPLTPGRYRLRAHALDETATRLYDTVERYFSIEGPDEAGLVRIEAEWL
jgi:lipopolysaccharide transport system ATP-binding protein